MTLYPKSLLGLMWILLATSSAAAQNGAGEEISFFSSDYVELVGTYYPTQRGKSPPCVLLIHAINGSRQEAGWAVLARYLQKEGYAVLSFDFRGHGQSKAVAPEFWQLPLSRSMKPMSNGSVSSIDAKQFTRPIHYASLVNDIRAARRVFELKDRKGFCDASQIFVIGADTGASLGLLWIDAEWQRWRITRDSTGRPNKQGPEALDIAGAVWLSFNPNWPGRYSAAVENWLVAPASERTPMGFLYGGADPRSKSHSVAAFEKLTKSNKENVHKLTTIMGIPDSTRAGSDLMEGGDRIPGMIASFLGNVTKDRRRPIRSAPDLESMPPLFNTDVYGFR